MFLSLVSLVQMNDVIRLRYPSLPSFLPSSRDHISHSTVLSVPQTVQQQLEPTLNGMLKATGTAQLRQENCSTLKSIVHAGSVKRFSEKGGARCASRKADFQGRASWMLVVE